jgi:hypothetical protein
MSTPLYRSLNPNGVSTYAFPSAAEDLGQSFQNDNYTFYFSHYALLNIPTQRLQEEPIYLNFSDTTTFPRASFANIPKKPEDSTYSGQLIESLRNYVANKDETLRISRTSPNTYHYDQNIINTPTERIFYQWLKKLGVLQLEIADGPKEVTFGDSATIDYGEDWTWNIQKEYDDSAGTVNRNNRNNIKYFKEGYWYEVFWKERQVVPKSVKTSNDDKLNITLNITYDVGSGLLLITLNDSNLKQKNFKVGDYVEFTGVINDIHKLGHPNYTPLPAAALYLGYTGNEKVFKISTIILPLNSNQSLQLGLEAIDINPNDFPLNVTISNYCTQENPLSLQLIYERVVQYVGEITEINNVEVSNRNITEITSYTPEQAGRTPKVLFRTRSDKNYRPGINFPFLPAQWEQREIQGAETSNHPMISNPNNYPGNYWAQFDRKDATDSKWQYSISSGDSQKRTGDFFGVYFYDKLGNPIAYPGSEPYEIVYDSSYLDGISIDFNTKRYTNMVNNLQNPELNTATFEEFSSTAFNNLPPVDFEFNAVAWYYTVVDNSTGEAKQNLYGISFVDHPDNACNAEEVKEIPRIKKYAPNDQQDGSAYILSLNLNYSIINEQLIAKYDPTSGHNLRDFLIYAESISKLTEFNELFTTIVEDNKDIRTEIFNLKGLIYTETDLKVLNEKLIYLETLLNLYKSLQIADSESIVVSTDISVSPPVVKLNSIEKYWNSIITIKTSLLFDPIFATINDYTINVPTGRSMMIQVLNDDNTALTVSTPLVITLDRDLSVGQFVKIMLLPNGGYQNKKLDIRIINPNWNPQDLTSNQYYYLYRGLDLPVDANANYVVSNGNFSENNQNSFGVIKRADPQSITNSDINSIWTIVTPESELVVILNKYHGYFEPGDIVSLDNFVFSFLDTNGRINNYNLSGQLPIKRIVHNVKKNNLGEVDFLLKLDPNVSTNNYNKEPNILKKTIETIINYLNPPTPSISNILTPTDINNLLTGNKFNSLFPLGCTALVFNYESSDVFDQLINIIKLQDDTATISSKLNPDKFCIDAQNGNLLFNSNSSWDSLNKIRNFSHNQPNIKFNKGLEIDVYKVNSDAFSSSFLINSRRLENIKRDLTL